MRLLNMGVIQIMLKMYFELISEENENVFIKSSSLYDIGSYLYGVYKDNHPEEDEEGTDNYNSDGYEYYDWSSGF